MIEEILLQPSLETRTCHKRDTRRDICGWDINVINLPDPASKVVNSVLNKYVKYLLCFSYISGH